MTLLPDLRLAVRHLLATPLFTLTIILTFGVAIAANSAIFSAVHAVLLRPVPVTAPERLAVIWQTDAADGKAVIELTHRHLREWTTGGSAIFESASAMGSHNWDAILEGRGEPQRVWMSGVTASFFDTLGVPPFLGRTFRPQDDVPNAAAVAVLNHGAWVRLFGADPDIVGKPLQLDGGSLEIVGVMPPGVDFPRGADFWTPVVPILTGGEPASTTGLDSVGVLYVVGRLRSGLDAASAAAAIDRLESELDRATPGRLKWGDRTVVTTLLDHLYGQVRPALWWLLGAVAVLLLIACANVSGLLLTRLSVREREHAVRLALGATMGRIRRLWLIEVLMVALAGGLAGLGASIWLARAIAALAPPDVPNIDAIGMNLPVALTTLATILGAALLAGLVPLQQMGRTGPSQALAAGSRHTGTRASLRARSALVTVQIAMAIVLLVAAGLVVRSFARLQQLNLGFSAGNVTTLVVQPRSIQIPPNEWFDQLLDQIRVVPGVTAVGAVYLRPLALGPIGQGVLVGLEGQPTTREAAEQNPTLNYQVASPGYFEAMRTPLVRGRLFDDRDTMSTPRVAIVSESTARRLWPGQDPIGRRIHMSTFTPGAPPKDWRTVVGVVSDVRYRGLMEVQLDVYDPARQVGLPADNLVVRSNLDAAAVAGAVRAVAQRLDPAAIVDNVRPLDDIVARASAPWRMSVWLFTLFALLAVALAAVGLFGLVALNVTHRQHEFAVRLALGSSPSALVRTVLADAWWRAGLGVCAGLFAAALGTRAMTSLLYEVRPLDPVTYATVGAAVAVVVTVAAWLPARRAARATPQSLFRNG